MLLNKYSNEIYGIYEQVSKGNIKDLKLRSSLPGRHKKSLERSINKKIDIIRKKEEKLKGLLEEQNWKDRITEEFKIYNFQYEIKGHILIIICPKEEINNNFFNGELSNEIEEIGFLVKEHNLNFDIIITSNEELIEHEIKESITDYFLDNKQEKTSIFQLDKVDPQEKNIKRSILQDMLSHFFSSEIDELEEEINNYISYTQMTSEKHPKFKEILKEIVIYLYKLQTTLSIEKNKSKLLLTLIGNPARLSKLYPNMENKIYNIKTKTHNHIFDILSTCNVGARFCTITRRRVNKTYSEDSSYKYNEQFTEEIETCLNLNQGDTLNKLKHYFHRIKKEGKVKEIVGELKNNSILRIIWQNGIETKIRINNSGNISFLVEHSQQKQTTKTTKYKAEVDERTETRQGKNKKLSDEEVSRKEIYSRENTIVINTIKDENTLKKVKKWVEHIINMKISAKMKTEINISKSLINKVSESKEIITTPFHIDNPDVHQLLSIYIKNILESGEVKQVVGNIGGEMKLVKNDGSIDEMIITEKGYIGFHIIKTTKEKIEKTVENTHHIKDTSYNIESKDYTDEELQNIDQEISFSLLEKSSSLDEKTLKNKERFIDSINKHYTDRIKEEDNKSLQNNTIIQKKIGNLGKKNLSDGINKLGKNIKNNLETKLTNIKESKFTQISNLYQSSIFYAVEQINEYIKEDRENEQDATLFSYQGKEMDIVRNGNHIELISFFQRKSDIDGEMDRLQVTIKIDKETEEVEIINDWHRNGCNMCSSHQMFDNIFDESLSSLGLEPERSDQGKAEELDFSYEDVLEETKGKIIKNCVTV